MSRGRLSIVIGVALCGVVAGWARGRLAATISAQRDERDAYVFLLPPGEVIRSADLGYHSLAADLLFIRANLYYGRHILGDEHMPWLDDFINILLTVDPDFKKAYLWSANVATFRKRGYEYNKSYSEQAIDILERGMSRFVDDYRFPMRIGFNYYYDLGDAWRGIPYFELASQKPNAPAWLREKLVDLYAKKGRLRLARKILAELVMEADDPVLRKGLQDRMTAMMDDTRKEEISRRRATLINEWQDSYGYLPLDLYLLIREQ